MSRIFLTGDSHFKEEYQKVERLCKIAGTTKDDCLIVLGDHGCLYYYRNKEKKNRQMKSYLESLPISFVLIKGNHDRRPNDPVFEKVTIDRPEIKGVFYVEPEYPSIMYTEMYGQYEFCGKKAYVLGGAYSIDKYYRLEKYYEGFHNYLWFADEQMSKQELNDALNKLQSSSVPFDLILSHTCPMKYEPTDQFISDIDQNKVDKTMEMFFDKIEETVPYKNWYCGHYHIDRISLLSGCKLRFMYNDIIEIGDRLTEG